MIKKLGKIWEDTGNTKLKQVIIIKNQLKIRSKSISDKGKKPIVNWVVNMIKRENSNKLSQKTGGN